MTTEQNPYADEVTVPQIAQFFRANGRLISGMTIVATIAAAVLCMLLPRKFEANFTVEMAKIGIDSAQMPPVVDVEKSAALNASLSKPESYVAETLLQCGIANPAKNKEAIIGIVKTKLPTFADAMINITVIRNSQEDAEKCANGVLKMIRDRQHAAILAAQAAGNVELGTLKQRLKENQEYLQQMEKSNLFDRIYLAKRDEYFYLMRQIDTINTVNLRARELRLVDPVYAPANPVSPRLALLLPAGAVLGFMIGILVALYSQMVRRRAD